jgi:hypothetical protein
LCPFFSCALIFDHCCVFCCSVFLYLCHSLLFVHRVSLCRSVFIHCCVSVLQSVCVQCSDCLSLCVVFFIVLIVFDSVSDKAHPTNTSSSVSIALIVL